MRPRARSKPRDAKVLRLYFGLEGEREHTLEEIGNLLGVTRERIRQLRDRALRRLREGAKGVRRSSRSQRDDLRATSRVNGPSPNTPLVPPDRSVRGACCSSMGRQGADDSRQHSTRERRVGARHGTVGSTRIDARPAGVYGGSPRRRHSCERLGCEASLKRGDPAQERVVVGDRVRGGAAIARPARRSKSA